MAHGTIRMILYAAARVLGCGSVQMTLLDEERKALVFTTSITNRDLPRLYEVESALGFPLEGAELPLAAETSIVVRAFREGRVIVSEDVAELAGSALPPEILEQIRATIGPRGFAAVPIGGRAGAVGVLIFEKRGAEGFSTDDRELLVAYADRVGADLESQALSDDVRRLEALSTGAPVIYACDRELKLTGGPDAGRPLFEVVGLPARVTVSASGEGLAVAVEDREASETLRREGARAREHLTKVMRSIADAILTLDAGGLVSSANDAVAQAFGRSPAELVGSDALSLCADERSRKKAIELSREARASGFAEGELRLYRRDRSSFAAEVSALLLADNEGGPAGVLWRIHDLTERRRGDAERKRLRARLLHSERLSALGEMAARIAHEVRNPLVSIGAAAQVVAEELPPSSAVTGEVQAIAREVKRLDAIVSDFLRFARPRRAERREVDLAPVVKESVDLVRAKAGDVHLAVDTPLLARCDPDGIKQVLLNVLLNAVEAAPSGPVECEAHALGEQVVLSVADRGPGVPDSAKRRVFDPFFSTKTRGTGLGLAVSKQIVDEHHGRIRLLSRRGGGTRVVIELPVG
jgi:PAS domain S-box-containing protein